MKTQAQKWQDWQDAEDRAQRVARDPQASAQARWSASWQAECAKQQWTDAAERQAA